MIAPTLGLLAMLVGIATVWLMNTRPAREQDPDARFWYGFTGFCVLAPMLLIAASVNRAMAAAALVLIASSCLVTDKFATRCVGKRAAAESASRLDAEHAELRARHDSVLRAWSRYALDPAAAIDFPAMNDVQVPEVSALAKALAEAEQLRRNPPPPAPEHSGAGYRQAIGRLEEAFWRAERAALETRASEQILP